MLEEGLNNTRTGCLCPDLVTLSKHGGRSHNNNICVTMTTHVVVKRARGSMLPHFIREKMKLRALHALINIGSIFNILIHQAGEIT